MKSKPISAIRDFFLRVFRSEKDPEIEKMIGLDNIRSFAAAALTVAAAELLFLLFSILFFQGGTGSVAHPVGILCSSASCMLASFLAGRYLKKVRRTGKINCRVVFLAAAALYLFTSAMTANLDIRHYKNGEQMLFFYIAQFCFLMFLRFKPYQGTLLTILSFGWFCGRIIGIDGGSSFNYTSLIICFVLAVFGNAIKYNALAAHCKDRLDLEMQKAENEIIVAQGGKYVVRYDLKTRILHNATEASELFGLPPQEFDPQNTHTKMDFVLPESREPLRQYYENMMQGIPNGSADFHFKKLDGALVWLHSDYTLQADQTGQYVRSVISFSDVTHQIEQQLIHEQRIGEIVSLTRDCHFYAECSVERWVVDDIRIVANQIGNPLNLKGRRIDDVIENECKPIVYADDFTSFKEFFSKNRLQLLNANSVSTDRLEFRLSVEGKLRWYGIDLCLVHSVSSSELNFFVIFRDIDAAHTQYARLVNQAKYDQLTGIYNRETTLQLIEEYLSGEGAAGTHALLMIDIDNLKKLNDTLGHQVGDEALRKVGACFKETFLESDIYGRIGGDEFFIFIKNISVDKVIGKTKAILSDLQMAFSGSKAQLITTASAGITMYHGNAAPGKTLKMLYAEADAALYKSKTLGKGIYTFADELDALTAASSSDLLQNDLLSYNLRGLLDNLANGIAIFHGMPEGSLTPVFCNARLPELLAITQEQFFSHMSGENGYGIHPGDLDRAMQALKEVVQTKESDRNIYRLLTGRGDYRYVTVFFNVHFIEDGSFDLYCIFSDAEETEQLRHLQENRRRQFRKKWMQAAETGTAYILLNITKNACGESYHTQEPFYETDFSGTVEAFLAGIARNIPSKTHRKVFLRRFALDTYEKELDEGIFNKEMRLPLLQKEWGVHWYQVNTELYFDPDTGDIEVFLCFLDIDNEIRLGYAVDRILDNEYEYLCQIDIQSGFMTRLGKTSEDNISDKENGRIRYREKYVEAVQTILPAEYRETGIEALSLDRIVRELEDKERYTVVFPVILNDGRGERLCQWSCEYTDEIRSTILMCRKNISKYLDYGYDTVTGMYARNGFYRKVENELKQDLGCCYVLLEIDFDNFKLINEEQGYSEGSRFLRQFAASIYKCAARFDKNVCIGRFEADHFLIFLRMDDGVSPEKIYDELAVSAGAFAEISRLRLRMGVYEVTDPAQDVAYMCDCAHIAHRVSKGSFTNCIARYTTNLRDTILDEQLLASEMQNALDTEEFEVWFQPQVNHADRGSLIGAEALVRWNHPKRGMISPAVFIPLFEQNGSIYELDKYVWRRVCQYIRRWLDEGTESVPISVNISRMDILQNDFMESIVSAVEEQKIPYDRLHLEITESVFSENSGKVVNAVKELIELGFNVAIDDFGSGYSSLSMLKAVPAQVLKLDMRFFQDDVDSLRNECILQSVIRMAKMLGMAVLAEGVERIEQADFLRSLGCNYIQGFLYSKPLPYAEFAAYSENRNKGLAPIVPMKTRDEWETDRVQSHELFRSIISGSNDIIIVTDIKTKQLLYANRAAERFYGKGFDPMAFTTCGEYCNQREICVNCPANDLKKGERKERMFTNKGVHMKTLYIRMDWNGHDAFVCYQVDISAEIELADSLIRNIPGATILFEPDENGEPQVRYLSELAKKIFSKAGIDKETLTFEDCISVVHPDDKARIKAAVAVSIRETCVFREEFRIMLKDEKELWIELIANPVAEKNGKYQFYGVYTDISDRKNAQARTDALIQSIPSAMTIYEISGEGVSRIFISDNAKKILNASEAMHEKVDIDEVYSRIHAEDEQRIRDITTACFRNREPFSVQFRLKGEGDLSRWVQLDSTPVTEDADNVLYYSIYTDITAQKQIEQDALESDVLLDAHAAVNTGLQEALRQPTPELFISYTLDFVGRTLHGERTCIFEKNPDGTDSNTFEWVADGVSPEKGNLQNIPAEVTQPWYEEFKREGVIVIPDAEDIKASHPQIYEFLAAQNIRSLIAAPFFDEHGEPMGFFVLDNPPAELLKRHFVLMQTVAYFIEAVLKQNNTAKETH